MAGGLGDKKVTMGSWTRNLMTTVSKEYWEGSRYGRETRESMKTECWERWGAGEDPSLDLILEMMC